MLAVTQTSQSTQLAFVVCFIDSKIDGQCDRGQHRARDGVTGGPGTRWFHVSAIVRLGTRPGGERYTIEQLSICQTRRHSALAAHHAALAKRRDYCVGDDSVPFPFVPRSEVTWRLGRTQHGTGTSQPPKQVGRGGQKAMFCDVGRPSSTLGAGHESPGHGSTRGALCRVASGELGSFRRVGLAHPCFGESIPSCSASLQTLSLKAHSLTLPPLRPPSISFTCPLTHSLTHLLPVHILSLHRTLPPHYLPETPLD